MRRGTKRIDLVLGALLYILDQWSGLLLRSVLFNAERSRDLSASKRIAHFARILWNTMVYFHKGRAACVRARVRARVLVVCARALVRVCVYVPFGHGKISWCFETGKPWYTTVYHVM